jgi:Kef-type K+ transport system membrane component KefB
MAPFGLGAALALLISGQYSGAHRLEFVLLIAVAMSVTAFPVLARILTDSGLHRTRLGSLALACAAVDDVLAWSLLAVVVALTGGADAAGWPILLLPAYLVMMFLGVRPLLRRLIATEAKSGPNHQVASGSAVSVIVAGVLISGGLCQWMGLHLLFGAFLFGGMFPRKGTELFRAKLRTHVNEFNSMLLLPAFFVIAGLGVNVTGLGLAGFGELGLVLLVAIGGKMGGTFVGARLHCLPVRQSVALAVLMNTRGLTELVILSAGRQLGLLDQRLYSIMVLMAVLTTMMAGPLLRVTYRVTAAPTNDQVRRAS